MYPVRKFARNQISHPILEVLFGAGTVCSLFTILRGSASASIGYFEISCFASHSQHAGDGVSVYTHTQVATVFITFALSTSVMLPLFRFPSVTFPNLDGITNPEGRRSFGLLSTETGLFETFLGIGVDVLSFPEDKESSDMQPPDEDESVSVDCTETSDSSSLKQSL